MTDVRPADYQYDSPRWSAELLDCSMPMTLDTYSACAYNCQYCFSFFQRAACSPAYLAHRVSAVDVNALRNLFTLKEVSTRLSQFKWYVKQRYTVQWGGLSDGFDEYERRFGVSLELLKLFREIEYPISISTKATWFLSDKRYTDLLRGAAHIHFKISLITLNDNFARQVEMGAPSVAARLGAMNILRDLGVAGVTARFRPFILGVSADYPFTDRSREQLGEYARTVKAHGADSLTTEFLCWESRASGNGGDERLARLSRMARVDLDQLYHSQSLQKSGLMRLNYEIKRPYMDALQSVCEATGLRFYVSDAHHKEKSDCAACCGLPNEGSPVSHFFRGHFAQALQIAKHKGWVEWEDISGAVEEFNGVPFNRAAGLNAPTKERAERYYQPLSGYIQAQWNNIDSAKSLTRYFGGVLVPCGTDHRGNVIYLFNQPYSVKGERVETIGQLLESLKASGYDIPGRIINRNFDPDGNTKDETEKDEVEA